MAAAHTGPPTTPSPFLPSSSDLWFRLHWLQSVSGAFPFAFFLFDRLTEEFPAGPPSPPGYGPLTWTGLFGARRRFAYEEIKAVCYDGNFAALSSQHYHLLPVIHSYFLLQNLREAVDSLSHRLHALLTRHPDVEARWAPLEIIDLDAPSPLPPGDPRSALLTQTADLLPIGGPSPSLVHPTQQPA